MDFYGYIEDYINGRLSDEDLTKFEQARSRDPDLERAVRLYGKTSAIYDGILDSELHKQIVLYDNETALYDRKIDSRRSQSSLRKVLSHAAAILILLTATALWFANSLYSDTALVKKYLDLPNLSGTRAPAEGVTTLIEAQAAYSAGNYEQCILILTGAAGLDADTLDSRQLLGYSFLANGDHEKAIDVLSSIASSGYDRKERAEFHLALAFLQAGNADKVIEIIDGIIADNRHPYYYEAAELKDQLTTIWRTFVF